MTGPNDPKVIRANAKRAVTRVINDIRKSIAADDIVNLDEKRDKLKDLFKDFEEACATFEEGIQDCNELDKCDAYFSEVQDNFIKALEQVKTVKQHNMCDPDSVKPQGVTQSGTFDMERLVSAINMPKVEIEVFNGNPMKYHQFMRAFDLNVHDMRCDENMKLTRLLQYCSGSARDALEGCMLIGGKTGYDKARKILEERFGDPHMITERIVINLRRGKPVKSAPELLRLSDELSNASMILTDLNMTHEVAPQSVIVDILERTPFYVQQKWQKRALGIKKGSGSYPKFQDLCEFVSDIANEATDPVYGQHYPRRDKSAHKINLATSNVLDLSNKAKNQFDTKGSGPDNTPSSVRTGTYAKPETQCVLCGVRHRLWHCDRFKSLSVSERLKLVEQHKLCHNCLLPTHTTASCGKKSVCFVEGCGQRHTMYLHVDAADKSAGTTVAASNCFTFTNKTCYMPIVKVKVNDSDFVYAVLDTASTNTFCTRALVDKLGIHGKTESYRLCTLNDSKPEKTESVSLSVESPDGDHMHMTGVYVVPNIPVASATVDVNMFDHLRDLHLADYTDNDTVDLLIGQDHFEALMPLEVRRGNPGEPFAFRSCLGWCLSGRVPTNRVSCAVVSHFITTAPLSEPSPLEMDIDRLWQLENDGLERVGFSQEDHEVIRFWDEHCKKDGFHYELPIPWKNPDEPIPNNVYVAKSRLKSLVKKLARDDLYDRYEKEIDKLLEKNYAEEVPESEIESSDSGKIWYLPHHAVISEKKPGKVRVVYDCASQFHGKSLNDRCFQGPDLVNKLLFVLLRFRLHQYAIQADIEAMYNQIRIPLYDRNALRFLWLRNGEIVHYRMKTHLFGGIWCSSSSAYALRRTVHDCKDVEPLVKDTVEKAMYVDDCLKCVSNKQDAKLVVTRVPEILHSGGFNLTKFIVNDKSLMCQIDPDRRAVEIDDFSPQSQGKVLGVKWNIFTDEFYFDVNYDIIPIFSVSRRKILSIVSSIYDPLGFVGPLILPGKLIFQDTTRLKVPWDDIVNPDIEMKWKLWIETLTDIGKLRIPRCVKPSDFDFDAVIELHHFADASLQAYGACSFVRCINKDGKIHTQLLISKSKLAPIHQSTIPRLELQAAVIAAKLDSMLRGELDICIDGSYFWTDSQIALSYIKNKTRRFHVFVENRVSVIRKITDVNNWNHVGSKDNPADFLTRSKGLSVDRLNELWFQGPDWLRNYKCDWPKQPYSFNVSDEDPEVKSLRLPNRVISNNSHLILAGCSSGEPVNCAALAVPDTDKGPVSLITSHFSDWVKMQRALAWMIRFVQYLRNKNSCKTGCLTVDEIRTARIILIRFSQRQCYPNELHKLSRGHCVNKSSSLRSLNPYLDSDGVMCVGGRIHRQHPYVIPHNHSIAEAIVWYYHNRSHAAVEWTLSLVREHFWIVRARPLVKRVIYKCMTCKMLYARPQIQKMADLPDERLQSHKPVFSNIGVDLFGPIIVKNYRTELKRYGCVFTCLASRALHIEKLNSLDADSFINAFRRFVARRGLPEKAFSDNGTNFVSGEKELRVAFNEIARCPAVMTFMVAKNIEWSFIPPSAPHMGGIWERMVGVIKRVLAAVLKDVSRFNDEMLETFFCEVENIVNGRPLTKVSEDPNDSSPLTPNHLLIMRQGPSLPPGRFSDSDLYRRRWRHVQHVADSFWRQWLRLYLPELQKRIKWNDATRNIAVGDLVLVAGENTPRGLWPLALVKEVSVGRDGLVRSVKVRTRATELVRPVTKIVLLEADAVT